MNLKPRPLLVDKVTIITGASSGIGEATAREFAQAGAIVVIAARRAERLEQLAQEIQRAGGTVLAVPTDLTDPNQIHKLISQTLQRFGRIDILVNIAGAGNYDWFENHTYESLLHAYATNILGMAELIRQVIPTLQAQRAGLIINMSSYASRVTAPPLTLYSSTKAAVDRLTDGLRRELRPWGIEVIRIHPSEVSGTEFMEHAVKNKNVNYRSVPLGRVKRETVAKAIVHLVERPRRTRYVSRLNDILVFLDTWKPGLLDWLSAVWVRARRKEELPMADEVAPVKYSTSMPWLFPATLVLGLALAQWVAKKRG